GDVGNAASSLREALSVWRGDALTDLVPGPVLSAEASRLEDARRGVLEQRVEADLRLGLHRELIGELKVLMMRYPGHEEFCAQLMVAAYRSGRRDESLAAYDRLRRVVVEQTGLEPSERLRRLQHAVLVDSPSLNAPEPGAAPPPLREPPAELPPGPEQIVGRAHDLALIGAALRRRPATASPGLVVVAGAPGTGKTATALFAAHRLREKFPDGQLFAALHGDSGRPVDPLAVLQGFLRSVSTEEPPAALEAAARRFRSWTAERRVLVVLDDAASAAQVVPLLPNGRGCSTLITSRRQLPGLPGAALVRLGGLDPCDAFQLLSLLVGEPRVLRDPEAALELAELCDRNPFAIRVAGERLAARPLLGLPELAERLRGEALRLLAGLGSGNFDLAQAMAALCADERTTRRLLNSLIDALLVEDTALIDGPAAGGEDWPWSGRRFRLPTLLRLAWSDARASETETPRSRRRGVLCRTAARPHQSHTVRLLRYSCIAWGATRYGSGNGS